MRLTLLKTFSKKCKTIFSMKNMTKKSLKIKVTTHPGKIERFNREYKKTIKTLDDTPDLGYRESFKKFAARRLKLALNRELS